MEIYLFKNKIKIIWLLNRIVLFLCTQLEKMKTGIELIAIERQEHFEKHGFTVGIDLIHNNFNQLSEAACRLCEPDENKLQFNPPHEWDNELWNKMIHKSYKERLIIAGSLIAAEIDRVQNEINPLDDVVSQ